MKSFNNWTHKNNRNHIFYTHAHFYLILVWDSLYIFVDCFCGCHFDISLSKTFYYFLTLSELDSKSAIGLGWDLVFVLIVVFIHYKMISIDNITNENNKEHNKK